MKKFLLFGATLFSLFILASCGSKTNDSSSSSNDDNTSYTESDSSESSSTSERSTSQSSSSKDDSTELTLNNIVPYVNTNTGKEINGMGLTVTKIAADSKPIDDYSHMVEVDIEVGNNSQFTPIFIVSKYLKVTASDGAELLFNSGDENADSGTFTISSGTNDYKLYFENGDGNKGPFKVSYQKSYWIGQ